MEQKTSGTSSFLTRPLGFGAVLGALVVLAAVALITPQYGHLSVESEVNNLFTIKLLPYVVGGWLLTSALFMAGVGLGKRWLNDSGWAFGLLMTALTGGVVITTAWESHQVLEIGHWGMSNLYEVSLLLLFMLGALGLWLERSMTSMGLGAFLAPLWTGLCLFTLWLFNVGQAGPRELMPALQNVLLPWHVLANFIGYGAFMVAAAAGVLVVVRHIRDKQGKHSSLPTVSDASQVMDRAIIIGFPVFTVAILLGCLWAYEAWGGYWSWDPKETWALIVWLTYAGYLHARHLHSFTPVRRALFAFVGFGVTLFCFLGVNMFLSGLHSYGSLM